MSLEPPIMLLVSTLLLFPILFGVDYFSKLSLDFSKDGGKTRGLIGVPKVTPESFIGNFFYSSSFF